MNEKKTKGLEQKLEQIKKRTDCIKQRGDIVSKHTKGLLIDCNGDVMLMIEVISEIDELAKMIYSSLDKK